MESAAVLTGDLIGSAEVDPGRLERTMTALAHHASLIGPDTRFTRYRGDGWQIYLPQPKEFLWVAVYLNAILKADPQSLASRISIGLGTANTPGQNDLAGASGTAFVTSGRALDRMDAKGRTLTLSGEGTDEIQRSTIAFVEDRIQGWSRAQAQVIAMKLRPNPRDPDAYPTQDEMSHTLGITRQAVAGRLQAAGWALILNACVAFHDHFDARARHV